MNQARLVRDWLAERAFGFLGFALGVAILVGVVSHQNSRLDRIEHRTTKVEHRTTIVERQLIVQAVEQIAKPLIPSVPRR